jgi:hypothetical protein
VGPPLVTAGRVLRGFAGVVTGGLVAALIALAVAWYLSSDTGFPGPETGAVVWHAVGVLVAVPAQVYADRHPDRRGNLVAALVIVGAAALLTVQWLA